ncbi:MAG TPA: DAK2 domain-containing protein [Asanoa sp.]
MLETLDAAALRRWCASGLAALRRHQGEIDELNVYPVSDGDTGTNLVLTLTSAQQALAQGRTAEGDATAHGRVLRLMARGALLGARGNSGVILAQLLRGLADALSPAPAVDGPALARALRAAATAAYAAVGEPVEGTILTVARAAAAGATGADLGAVARGACAAAAEALAGTPRQLPALARAGVVDAGGRGLCVLLEALVEVVTGESVEAPPAVTPRRTLATAREAGSPEYAYEVQYLLDAPSVNRLRETLAGLGDSLVVVGEPPTWKVHVHVNDVGAAIEAGVAAGRPHRIEVTRFDDEPRRPRGRAVVVVASGEGLAALFAAEGAGVVRGEPSTGELLAAIRATGASQVVVLPGGGDMQAVAVAAADKAADIRVSVVPTRSPVQALAALAVRDPARRFDDDVIAMAEAAGACRWAEVCFAARDALTLAGPCREGDVLALVEGEVHLVGGDLTGTCRALLDRLLGGGGELVTLLTGADAPPGLAADLAAHATARWPFVEVQAFDGGQPHHPLLVGVE